MIELGPALHVKRLPARSAEDSLGDSLLEQHFPEIFESARVTLSYADLRRVLLAVWRQAQGHP